MGARWQKVIRDLWRYKVRTLLVVLSIAAGAAALARSHICPPSCRATWYRVTPRFVRRAQWCIPMTPSTTR